MYNLIKMTSIAFMVVSLNGCQGQQMNKQGGGTLIGGVAGGLLGSQFGKGSGQLLTTGIGTLAGAFAGNLIGQSLDEQDKKLLANSSQRALEFSPSGSPIAWKNPDSGNSGTVTPMRASKKNGRYCREYSQEVLVAGKKQSAYGTACRQPDGTWEIIK